MRNLRGPSRRLLSSSPSGGVLLVAEHAGGAALPSTLNALTASSAMSGGAPVSVLVAGGEGCAAAAEALSRAAGVGRVIVAESAALEHQTGENVAATLRALQEKEGFSHIVAPSGTVGKDVWPRLAAMVDVMPVTDVVEVKAPDTFVRPVYAGNALSTVQSSDALRVVTVRPTSFEAAAADAGGDAAPVEQFDAAGVADAGLSAWVGEELTESDRPDLASAPVVVSGGRGMKNGENFKMLEELADNFGAAVGASRAAVDAGFVPNDMQVGQTGKVVAPSLYFAVGISGAIQHLAGMKDSKVIVAINKDAEAPIFQVADYGLEADLFKAVPELIESTRK